MSKILSRTRLQAAANQWLAQGKHVAGPRRLREDFVQYGWLTRGEELVMEAFIRPANSIKEFFLPRHEKLFAYQGQGRQVSLVSIEPPQAEQIILAARPCDAAALPVLDHVFGWDYQDPFFRQRRANTTVVTLACVAHDEHCFCTGVGLAPDATRGSDVLLVPLGDDAFEVRFVTERGRQLFEPLTEESTQVGNVPPGPEMAFDLSAVRSRLENAWDQVPWSLLTLRCVGCGACAHNCPTCHCFDIVDETSRESGCRVRNWDTCQDVMYSMHASGHNPRGNQAARQQNRIRHKFLTYPSKFGDMLCTGCGSCARNCPVGLGVRRVLQQIATMSVESLPQATAAGADTH
jgi:ferredoxin